VSCLKLSEYIKSNAKIQHSLTYSESMRKSSWWVLAFSPQEQTSEQNPNSFYWNMKQLKYTRVSRSNTREAVIEELRDICGF